MIWAEKQVYQNELRSVEILFREQAASCDPDNLMLLVGVGEALPQVRLWVGVPQYELLLPYYGFLRCNRRNLPVAPLLVAGDPVRFSRIFHN